MPLTARILPDIYRSTRKSATDKWSANILSITPLFLLTLPTTAAPLCAFCFWLELPEPGGVCLIWIYVCVLSTLNHNLWLSVCVRCVCTCRMVYTCDLTWQCIKCSTGISMSGHICLPFKLRDLTAEEAGDSSLLFACQYSDLFQIGLFWENFWFIWILL